MPKSLYLLYYLIIALSLGINSCYSSPKNKISKVNNDSLAFLEQRIRVLKDFKSDSIISYSQSYERIAKQLNNGQLKAKADLLYGLSYGNQGKVWLAHEHLQNGYNSFKTLEDSLGMAETLYELANYYKEYRLKLHEEEGERLALARSYYRKAMTVMSHFPSHSLLGLIWVDYGDSFLYEKADSAYIYYQKALQLAKNLNDGELLAKSYIGLSGYYLIKGNYNFEKAISYLKNLNEFSVGQTQKYQMQMNVYAGAAYLFKDDYKNAAHFLEKALPIADITKPLKYSEFVNFQLYVCYEKLGNSQKVITYLKKILELTSIDSKMWNQILHDGFQREHKSDKIKLEQLAHINELKQEQIEFQSWIVGLGILLSVILASLLILIFSKHIALKNAHQQVQAQKSKIEALFKEMHHRIKNNLQTVISILSWQQSLVNDDEVINQFQDAITRIQAVSLLHHKLYRHKSDTREINFLEYIKSLSKDLFMAYGIHNEVKLSLAIDPISLWFDDCVSIGLILNELISNSIKHAFTNTSENYLSISLSNNSSSIILVVKDNGPGFKNPLKLQGSETLGTELVQALAEKLKASIFFTNDQGAKVTLKVPAVKHMRASY